MNNSSNRSPGKHDLTDHASVPERINRAETVRGERSVRRAVEGQPSGMGTRRPVRVPSKRRGARISSVFPLIWAMLLCVLIIVIIAVAVDRSGTPDKRGGDTVGAFAGNTESSVSETEITTAPDKSAVDYAERNDSTSVFSSDLTFKNGILIDLESNTVLEDRNGDAKIYPASMTKVMSLIVACENAESLDDTFTMTADITDPLFQENASVAGFSVGEVITVRDMIYGLILPSGGDAAMGLAVHIAGSEENFAKLMNEKVKELGLTGTHFTNCTGLHDAEHYSTCHDIALILEYAIQDEFMRTVLSSYKYTTSKTPEHPEGIELTSTVFSRMYGDESESVFILGGKTGYTIEAKNCLCTFGVPFTPGEDEDAIYARSPKYILVTAGSGDKWGPVFDAISIYKELYAAQVTTDAADTQKASVTTENEQTTVGVRVYTAAPAVTK